MKKKTIILFCIISSILGLIIFFVFNHLKKDNIIVSEIIIRSPGQCAQKIIIKSNGNVEYIVGGITSYNYYREFSDFDYIKEIKKVSINSTQDIKFINAQIASFEKSKILNKRKKDALHMELFIKSEKKIDIYGNAPKKLLLVLERIKKHIPGEVDYACW